ncbi:MAG: type II secretion system protein E [Firmicutes bacterium HGW-Firmicutes-14]|nr:MAG: type II secretion system protein E [Firmicutes bacterium HGW-Firmicutes-14]
MSLLKRLEKEKSVTPEGAEKAEKKQAAVHKQDPYRELKLKIHKQVIEELDDEMMRDDDRDDALTEKINDTIENLVNDMLDKEASYIPRADRTKIIQEIIDEVIGLGPITQLLNDPTVSEVMVNSPDQVYIERKGRLTLSEVAFRDNEHVMHIIEKIVAPLGRRVDESSPMVDARLPDGSRVNAIIPPLALKGPCITIRKFSKDPLQIEDLIRFGSLTPEMAKFLEACVKARLNIVVSGGTGSGKTTTLNVLSSFIPNDERIVTCEDAAEIQLRQDHVVTLESRPPNIEGKGAVSIRDLVKNCLRMRPDRIVVGEVRSGEALDMLQAMNTGHDGSLTTGHANSPRDMLARLETMVLMAGMDLPVRAIREQMASAVDLIVQQSRLKDGTRKITHITEVLGLEGDTIVLQDIFVYEQKGVDEHGKLVGRFKPTGIRPKFLHKLETSGIRLPDDIFSSPAF